MLKEMEKSTEKFSDLFCLKINGNGDFNLDK